ncbi:LacI family DNA-binding transcriptional regulator [Stappia stellulata]|uniref:LacI family DNA-binding transcriptional regulator n=1 Tax=Stappia stellulata TaxID=71235 RepID=UPI000409E4E5|nr:LacI family DNA-binding transcriptional regulator [Stappia stellulata]
MSTSKRPKTEARAGRIKLADVATASGVHYSTVSRVLRPGSKGRISDAVAEHVKAVARELGYQPNSVAASMRTNSTHSIGLIVHDMSDPVYPPILTGIEEVLSPQGFAVLVGNTGYDIAVEMDVVNRMASRLVDGIFLATTRLEDPIVKRCQDLGIPLISVLRQTLSRDTPAVINDCLGGMRALTRQVLAWGHRDIAVILAPQNLSTGRERWRGIRDVLTEHGMTLPEHRIVYVEHMSADQGERAARSLLNAQRPPPEVIMCVNDLVAIGAIRACRAAGLNVPLDVGISGYNDIPLVDMIDPALTTVRMHLQEIGKAAGKMMLAHLGSEAPSPATVRIDAELVLRASLRNLNG